MKNNHTTADERKENERKENYLQGAFLGFIVGVLYLAIFSTILERL
jgi:membrane-associated protease RseP (regulator of RpoE activity)